MSNGKFLAGLTIGVIAGIAAKYAYDNKEELMDIALDNYYIAKDELSTFAQHSLEKAENLSKQAKEGADFVFDAAKEKIEDIYSDNYGKKLDMLVALTSVVKKIDLSKELKRIEKDIIKFINENNNVLKNKLNIVIDTLYENYREKFSIEYSDDEVRSFLILILMKREEQMYE